MQVPTQQGQSALRIELIRAERSERFEVHGGRALLGSGSHCDVRIGPDEGAAEQIAFELRGRHVLARTRSALPICSINGVPFAEQRLEDGALIQIGELAIRVARVEPGLAAGKRKDQAILPPQLQALALIGLAIAFYQVLQPAPEQSMLGTAVHMPALFPPQQASCPAAAPDAAAALALQLQLAADTKRERSPFRAGEGVAAVELYRQAAACLTRAGADRAARETSAVADSLAQRLGDELRVRQVRLERFLALARYDAAQREIHVLRSFMRDRSDPYTQWLAAVQREIDTRFASARRSGS
jgi:hypothetical protein